jgi:hypothetical protein
MRHTTARQSERRTGAVSPERPGPAMRLLTTYPWNGQAYCVLRALLKDTYFAPRRFLDLSFKALATDPLAGLTWYASHLIRIFREPKRMPR